MSEPALTMVNPLPTLLQLPDELLDCVISQIAAPGDTHRFGLTCKRAQRLTWVSLVWRQYCLTTWKFWTPRHDISGRLARPPLHSDWRQLYVERVRIDRAAAGVFEVLLLSQQSRVQRMQDIAAKGCDVRDFLYRLKDHTPDDAEDVLARRWHAEAILGMVHRASAVELWRRLLSGEELSLEEALSGYELFVLGIDRTGIVDDINTKLDRIAQGIRETTDAFDDLSTRQRAVCIAKYLASEVLVGNPDIENYHALRNNFFGVALFDEPHTALPLQTVAMYCAIASRLGVDAKASNVPGHVVAVIKAPPGQTLDGGLDAAGDGPDCIMHLDPWRHGDEVTPEELRSRLLQLGIPPHRHAEYFTGADSLEMVLRTSRNMLRSVESARLENPLQLDLEAAQYSALWAMFVLGDGNPALAPARRRYCLQFLVEHFQVYYPEDSALIMENTLPLLEGTAEHQLVSEVVARMQEGEREEKTQTPRGDDTSMVQYRIGHYFLHKRYEYRGFIVGWDPRCAAGAGWIERMGVDRLSGGREQPFYKIIGDDRSSRYVAQENIEVLEDTPPQALLRLGGRFFKRWDKNEKKFISNIRDEYPDD